MYLYYLFIVLLIIIITFYIFFKVKFPFWSRQPVFFYHDIFNIVYPRGVLTKELPKITRFYDNNVLYSNVIDIDEKLKDKIHIFIKQHYLRNKTEVYNPNKNDIFNYLIKHPYSSNCSVLMDKYKDKILATMTDRPNQCFIDNKKMLLSYIDWLCVDKNKRKCGLASKIIYTHYFNIRHKKVANEYGVCLFKNEGFMSPFMPLTTYNAYFYDLKYWMKDIEITQQYIKLIKVSTENFNDLIELFSKMKEIFKVIVMSDVMHIKHLIQMENLYIFMLLIEDEPLNFYVFRKTSMYYDNVSSIELVASFKQSKTDIFLFGFYYALDLLRKKTEYSKLLIENISHNNNIIKNVRYNYYYKIKYNYFFYNYATYPHHSSSVIIIN